MDGIWEGMGKSALDIDAVIDGRNFHLVEGAALSPQGSLIQGYRVI